MLPPVVLVGTHADCADGKKMGLLKTFLSRNARVFSRHIVQTSTVDNTRAGQLPSLEDPQIVSLRQEILNVADTMPHTKIEVPLKWLEVENKVYNLSKRGEKYTTRQKFKIEIFGHEGDGGDDSNDDGVGDEDDDENDHLYEDEEEEEKEEEEDEDEEEEEEEEEGEEGDDKEWEREGEKKEEEEELGDEMMEEVEEEEDDFEHLLNFLHDRGTIVYYDRADNQDGLVVLDPQWLINILCKIITVKQHEKDNLHVLSLRQDLHDKGILHRELLDHACKSLDLYDIKESLLFIMKKFNLLCECKDKDGRLVYLVPCMLTTKPADDLMGPVSQGSAPVFITFDTNYVPAGLFSRLLVLFGEWAASRTSCEQQQLFANAARFLIGKVTCLGFTCCKAVIKIHIWTMDNSNPVEREPEVSSEVSR